jgi:hypothetical protein
VIGRDRRSILDTDLREYLISSRVELTDQLVRFAVVPQSRVAVSGDYVLGSWETDPAVWEPQTERWERIARVLIGPLGGAVTISTPGGYGYWLRIIGDGFDKTFDPKVCGYVDFY